MLVRLYRIVPDLRPVALLDLDHERVVVEKLFGFDPLVADLVDPGGAVPALRRTLEHGRYVLTTHDPDDPFFREADIVPPEKL